MLVFGKILFGPVLLLQGRRVRRTTLRLPEAAGLREGVEGAVFGAAPLRLLVVGDSSAAGVGVEQQGDALAQPLATALSRSLQRPVAWQLVAQSGVDTVEALALLKDLHAADALVTVLGVNDVTAQHGPQRFINDYQRLLGQVRAQAGAPLFFACGLPPMHLLPALPQPLRWYLGACATRLDQALQQWIATTPGAHFFSLRWSGGSGEVARDGFHPGPAQYRQWAERLAGCIAPVVAPLPEDSRQIIRTRAT